MSKLSSDEYAERKSLARETEEAIDRWFSFVEEWNKNSTIPLSQVLISNRGEKGFSAPGSPSGAFNLDKRELRKIGVIS